MQILVSAERRNSEPNIFLAKPIDAPPILILVRELLIAGLSPDEAVQTYRRTVRQ